MRWLFGKSKSADAAKGAADAARRVSSNGVGAADAQPARQAAAAAANLQVDKFRQQEQQLLEWRLGVAAYRAAFMELARRLDVPDEEIRRIYCEHVSEAVAAHPELRRTEVFKTAFSLTAQP